MHSRIKNRGGGIVLFVVSKDELSWTRLEIDHG